jgi:5-methylthioadenosine/S-adenosylhomocysteine deaminase
VIVKDGKILDLLPTNEARTKYKAKVTHQLSEDHVVIPGLVNLHCHAAMSLLRGFADDVQLMDWLMHYMWPAEMRWVDEEFVRVGCSLSAAELIRSGVTTVNDAYFFPNISGKVFDLSGMRAAIGAVMIQFPSAWAKNVQEYFMKGLEVVKQFQNHPRVHVVFAPHATYTVDDPTFRRLKELAIEHDTSIHLHLHETQKEVDDEIKATGVRPIERLHRIGLLDERLISVHMTQLTDEDIALISKKGVHVVHCPESNLKLGSGICPVSKLLAAGANVCLGTDGPASNDDLDMLGEMRTSALVDKYRIEDPPVPAWKLLEVGTINGARALRLDKKIGSLEIGKEADMIAVKLQAYPVYNPVHTLIYVGSSTNSVEYVWVGGQPLLEESRLKTVNVSELRRDAELWGNKITRWHQERRVVDIKSVQTTLGEIESQLERHASAQQLSKQELEAHNGKLGSLKESLFHWTFFAGRGELVGEHPPTSQELGEISNRVQAFSKRIEEALSSSQ